VPARRDACCGCPAGGIKLNRTLIGLPARSVWLGESAVVPLETEQRRVERAAGRTAGTSMLPPRRSARYLSKLRESCQCGQWALDYS
jgi:hypothetical protein